MVYPIVIPISDGGSSITIPIWYLWIGLFVGVIALISFIVANFEGDPLEAFVGLLFGFLAGAIWPVTILVTFIYIISKLILWAVHR